MKLTVAEEHRLRELSMSPDRPCEFTPKLERLGLAKQGKGRPWGAFVAITKAGHEYLNTGMTPASGAPGLATNRKPRRGKARGVSYSNTRRETRQQRKAGTGAFPPRNHHIAAPPMSAAKRGNLSMQPRVAVLPAAPPPTVKSRVAAPSSRRRK